MAEHLKYRDVLRLALISSAAIAAVFCSVSGASAQTCDTGQYSSISQGSYTLENDEWGLSGDPGGWQEICTGSASTGAWSSTWFWSKGTGAIKAYPSSYRGWQDGGSWSPNAGGFPQMVSAQGALATTVDFTMTGDNQYDAAYDLFFSPSGNPTSPSEEMMVWLSYDGNQPAGSKIASAVALSGVSGTWDVWSGNVGWPVYSFVRTSQVSSFSGNLQPFVYYLAYSHSYLPTTYYELDIQFGIEIIQSNDANGSVNVTQFSALAN
jgi:hypothetical protein